MFKVIKLKKKFVVQKKNKNIYTPSGNILMVNNKKHANLLISELSKNSENFNDCSILGLTLFSCNLSKHEVFNIKEKIKKLFEHDNIFYRSFEEKDLIQLLNKKLNKFVNKFSKAFQINIKLLSSIMENQKEINFKLFQKYLDNLNIFRLTVFFKLSLLTKSVILSFFFLEKKLNFLKLYEFSNIENFYQQKSWGLTDEQKVIDKDFLNTLKNISIFFKIID